MAKRVTLTSAVKAIVESLEDDIASIGIVASLADSGPVSGLMNCITERERVPPVTVNRCESFF